ncbi:MAG: energy transducer TonB [Desulfobacteraceae bacterium]|nr:MAG: energy transducer TonB [Desulfobacteraceae bacterium]
MNSKGTFLVIGFLLSLMIHGGFLYYFLSMKSNPVSKISYPPSVLVPVKIFKEKTTTLKPLVKKEEPKPKPVMKKEKKPARINAKTPINPVPVSHNRTLTEEPTKPEDVKPVFGVTQQTVMEAQGAGMAVRIGNTVMKEQEEEYTPPAEVKEYITIPVFDLTTMPIFARRVKPEYPEALKEDELEGEVVLSVTIDEKGSVTEVRVIRADHALFAEEAVNAIKASTFEPATLNGKPVATILDDLVYTFILDE